MAKISNSYEISYSTLLFWDVGDFGNEISVLTFIGFQCLKTIHESSVINSAVLKCVFSSPLVLTFFFSISIPDYESPEPAEQP